MKVYTVSEDNHGYIAVTKGDIPTVIDFLLENKWITGNTKIWCDRLDQWVSIRAYFGEHWCELIKTWDKDTFNEWFEDSFYIEEYEVYGL